MGPRIFDNPARILIKHTYMFTRA